MSVEGCLTSSCAQSQPRAEQEHGSGHSCGLPWLGIHLLPTEATLQTWLGRGQGSLLVHAAAGAARCRGSPCRRCTKGLWRPQATSIRWLARRVVPCRQAGLLC